MGTHPIFESDFDCLTDLLSTLKIPKKGHAVDVIREPLSRSKRTRPTSSGTSQSSRGDEKARRTTSPESDSASRTRTSTTPPSTVWSSASPTRTSSPRSPCSHLHWSRRRWSRHSPLAQAIPRLLGRRVGHFRAQEAHYGRTCCRIHGFPGGRKRGSLQETILAIHQGGN